LFEVKDKDKYQKSYEQMMQLTPEFINSVYKDMNLPMTGKCEHKKAVSTYKGVAIDLTKLSFKMADVNSPEAQMINAMYGEGIEYRMAAIDDYFAMAIGGDTDNSIKELIDSVKAGDKALSAEVTEAMTLLGGAEDADMVGTANLIRLAQLITGFMPMPMPLPFDQMQTKTNIAFAGKISDGKVVIDVAIPKQHLSELVMGFMMMQMQTQPQPNAQPQVQP
jgi:hypothetical protein